MGQITGPTQTLAGLDSVAAVATTPTARQEKL